MANRVLPVTSAGGMVGNRLEDYLEVRPQRTVRVVHAMPNLKQKKNCFRVQALQSGDDVGQKLVQIPSYIENMK